MENNFDENALLQAKAMANSPAGKELLQMMQNMDKNALDKVMRQAATGDYSQLKSTLSPLLESKEIQDMLRQMGAM